MQVLKLNLKKKKADDSVALPPTHLFRLPFSVLNINPDPSSVLNINLLLPFDMTNTFTVPHFIFPSFFCRCVGVRQCNSYFCLLFARGSIYIVLRQSTVREGYVRFPFRVKESFTQLCNTLNLITDICFTRK